MIHLWHLVGAAMLLITLPLTLELILLSFGAALRPRRSRRELLSTLRLVVIVPAHNEEKLVGNCVRSLIAEGSVPTPVYVVAHNCTDDTAVAAANAGAQVLELNGPGGKGLALDYGFRHAVSCGAEAVLVIDADSVVSKNLLIEVTASLLAGADAVQTRYQAANVEANFRTQLAALALLGMNVLRPRGRSRLGLSCGIFGNGFALSARTLARVPYTANSLVEDLEYHLRLVDAGIKVEFIDRATVFGEMPERSSAATTQRARWEGGRQLMRRDWTLPLLRSVSCGNGRLFEPLLDLLAQPLATQAALLLVAFVIPGSWLHTYAALSSASMVLYVLISASFAPAPGQALRALAAAPGYLLWKLMTISQTRLAARRDAIWIRTQRNAEEPLIK